MHHTKIDGWSINFNSEPRGSHVIITAPDGLNTEIPYNVLEEFVGQIAASRAISAIESMSGVEFLASRR